MPGILNASARYAVLAFAAIGAASAMAAPIASDLSLNFSQPNGTVGPLDVITVNLTLTNNSSQTFVYDSSLPDGGLDASLLPATGNGTDSGGNPITAPFTSYSNVFLAFAFGCSGTFNTTCTSGPPYNFSFAASPFTPSYTLAAGGSDSLLFGTFTPSAGPVAPGTYEFYRGVLFVSADGLDANGNALNGIAFPQQTCNFDTAADCTRAGVNFFTRTVIGAAVTPVPEPDSGALLIAGLGFIGWMARRHRL